MIDIPEPTPSRQSLADLWKHYDERVVPSGASPIQRKETRRAFYAGMEAILTEMVAVADGHTMEHGEKILEGWADECMKFARLVREGKA